MIRLIPLVCLAGCAPALTSAPVASAEDACAAEQAQGLIGQQASQQLATDAMQRSGAKVVRWLRPNMAVTMEYRAGRLNILIDEKNQVVRITCG